MTQYNLKGLVSGSGIVSALLRENSRLRLGDTLSGSDRNSISFQATELAEGLLTRLLSALWLP